MKKAILLILLLSLRCVGISQDLQVIDSLNRKLAESLKYNLSVATHDTSRVIAFIALQNNYKFDRPDSALYYGFKALALAREVDFPKGEVESMIYIAVAQMTLGNLSKALQITLQGIKISEKNDLIAEKAMLTLILGQIYNRSEDYAKSLIFIKESMSYFDSLHIQDFSVISRSYLGDTYLKMDLLDSSLHFNQVAYKKSVSLGTDWVSNVALVNLGKTQHKLGYTDSALSCFHQSKARAGTAYFLFDSEISIAQLYHKTDRPDSSLHYAKKSMEIAKISRIYSNIISASILLSEIYEKRDPLKALEYNQMAMAYKDSLLAFGNTSAIESFANYDSQERQYEIDTAKRLYQNQNQRLWIFSITGALISAIILSLVLYRNNQNKQKANVLLKEQKEEVQVTLEKLESTQSQLIQSEKMASLGELTAGIAHEIQNPLNFVNNFSEVSKELADELDEEVQKPDSDKALLSEIAKDISQNQEKINHHGNRASGIVKGMLEHSRKNTGQKEPTDINKLADEYLRLAYHGLRAKDKSFNADFKMELDESLPKINVIPQDIGRVLLNLINNAFYAVDKKAKENIEGYKPIVTVGTTSSKSPSGDLGVKISVKDNGPGIPAEIKDKIFQPFFTTKPTGSGTGLGLSLSYDIVKAHGGELKVDTEEVEGLPAGEAGTQFKINLPV